jgi:UDP-N-acetylglucosamine--N-acetylmuramyl-(pentapeptide) pyrophosphoryl-undecaprenol N-acetylglucosamine transferase
MNKPLLVIMAGGTGGHVFPGLALAHEMQSQGWQVAWFGTAEKIEATLVPQHGFPIHFIDVKGVRGKGLITKLSAPFMLLSAVRQARSHLRKLQPKAVLGMGGFASGPGGIAAWTLGIPVLVHEQNAVFGMTNRWLAKIAKRVFCGFDFKTKAPNNSVFVGNPVRAEFFDINKQNAQAPFRLLIVGGSLGALALNQIVPEVLGNLANRYPLQVIHQAGKGKAEPVRHAYDSLQHNLGNESESIASSFEVQEFIDDIPSSFASADIIICRAGALTVAEVAASASCAIFVPLPIAVDDHQTYNARSLSDNDAAILIQQKSLSTKLEDSLESLLSDPSKIETIGRKARQLSIQDATQRVAQACIQEGLRKNSE